MSSLRRIVRISVATVAELSLVGTLAGFMFLPSSSNGVMVGLFVGALHGIALLPLSVVLLWTKSLARAVAYRLPIGIAASILFALAGAGSAWVMFGGLLGWLAATGLVSIMVADEGPRSGFCARCGYDLTGNVSGVCPECGTRVGSQENAG